MTSQIEAEFDALRERVAQWPSENRERFYGELEQRMKDPDTYAALCTLMIPGLQNFYLRKWFAASLELGAALLAIYLLLIAYYASFAVVVVVLLVFGAAALFKSQHTVAKYNLQIAISLENSIRDSIRKAG